MLRGNRSIIFLFYFMFSPVNNILFVFFNVTRFYFMTHLTVGLVLIYISRYPVGYVGIFFWSDNEVPFVKTDGYV